MVLNIKWVTLEILNLYQLETIRGLSRYGLQTGITQQVVLEYLWFLVGIVKEK